MSIQIDRLTLQKTLEYLLDRFKKYAEHDPADFSFMSVESFTNGIGLQAGHAKGSIFGISILMINSGFSDIDVVLRYTDQIYTIEKNAIDKFKAMKEKNPGYEKSGGLLGGHSFDDPAKDPALDSGQSGN